MLFYDYRKIYVISYGDPDLMLKYLPLVTGRDYIFNQSVLYDRSITSLHKAEYLGLLSLRSSNTSDRMNLDEVPPWIPKAVLEGNPLIQITNKHLIYTNEKRD